MLCVRILGRRCYSVARLAARGSYGRKIDNHKRVCPVFRKALEFANRVAIRDEDGEYTYGGLLESAVKLADVITKKLQGNVQERVAFVCPHDASYVIAQWACWISGQIAVPLCHKHPGSMLEYFITDCDSNLLLTVPEFEENMKNIAIKVGCKLYVLDNDERKVAMKVKDKEGEKEDRIDAIKKSLAKFTLEPNFYNENDAIVIYTSGSTGPPKGVVLSHTNLDAQVKTLVNAWEWQSKDCILHVLPLHHVHGIVNGLLCPLYVGARCVLRRFDTADVWAELMGVHKTAVDRVNILMGVPVMYSRLIDEYDASLRKTDRMMDYIRSTCAQKIRLFVCGSAPLPKLVFDRWEQITGHQLLERYGMTETGMILSNPLHGSRLHGSVGLPLPGVHVRIASDTDNSVIAEGSNMGTRVLGLANPPVGILHVRGESVFKQYWRKPNATNREFTKDGWFKTGDIVQYSKGHYTILGRKATDIISSGGCKVSAIQVESALLDYDAIKDVAVVGIDDQQSGQKIAAVVSVKEKQSLSEWELKKWASERLPAYAVPSTIKILDRVPRNVMGKVDKRQLARRLFPSTN